MDKNSGTGLLAIEETLAHLGRAVDELSEVVARQDDMIRRLERRLGLLLEAEAQRQAEQAGSIALADQPPPHY